MTHKVIRALIKIINLILVTLSFSTRAKIQDAESFWLDCQKILNRSFFFFFFLGIRYHTRLLYNETWI